MRECTYSYHKFVSLYAHCGTQGLALAVLISAVAGLSAVNNSDYIERQEDANSHSSDAEDDLDRAMTSRSTCGWLIFLAMVVFIVEGLVILFRFLNFGFVNRRIVPFLIMVSKMHTLVVAKSTFISDFHQCIFKFAGHCCLGPDRFGILCWSNCSSDHC